MHGITSLIQDISGYKVILGSGDKNREKSEELNRLMLVGQIMQAAAERDQALAMRGESGIRQVATAASWSLVVAVAAPAMTLSFIGCITANGSKGEARASAGIRSS